MSSSCRRRTSATTNATSASGSGSARPVGSGPSGFWVGGASRSRRAAVASRFATSSTCGRRAVVLLEPHDRRLRVPLREPEEVLGRRAGERVDRLVVVADDAEVVAVAEPALRAAPACSGFTSWYSSTVNAWNFARTCSAASGCSSIQAHRQPEHVLEVDLRRALLAALVTVEDALHQLGRDRRRVREPLDLGEVSAPGDHPVLRPLDLARELAPRQEPVRRRQGVRERRDQRRLRRQAPRGAGRPCARSHRRRELRERRRVERAGLDAARHRVRRAAPSAPGRPSR